MATQDFSVINQIGETVRQQTSDVVATNTITLTFDATPGCAWVIETLVANADDNSGDISVESPVSTEQGEGDRTAAGIQDGQQFVGFMGKVGEALVVSLTGLTAAGQLTVKARAARTY